MWHLFHGWSYLNEVTHFLKVGVDFSHEGDDTCEDWAFSELLGLRFIGRKIYMLLPVMSCKA